MFMKTAIKVIKMIQLFTINQCQKIMANLVVLSLLTVSRLLRENAAQVTSPYCQKTSLSRVSMWWNIWNKQSRNKCINTLLLFTSIYNCRYKANDCNLKTKKL